MKIEYKCNYCDNVVSSDFELTENKCPQCLRRSLKRMISTNNKVIKPASIEVCKTVRETYELIYKTLGVYLVLSEKKKMVMALWAMAASQKDKFISFPLLHFNAPKGSGKSRALGLLEHIIPNATRTSNISESALFRLPSQKHLNALLIDEAEHMNSEDKAILRELLNSCYKRGGKVIRVGESDKEGKRPIHEFDVFMGVAVANIWGLDSVLADRAIQIVLEKSNDPVITKLPEFFDFDTDIQQIANSLYSFDDLELNFQNYDKLDQDSIRNSNTVSVVSVSGRSAGGYLENLSLRLFSKLRRIEPIITHTTYTPYITDITDIDIETQTFIDKILLSDINGRSLELWLPLLSVAHLAGADIFDATIETAIESAKAKQVEDMAGDIDTAFSTFLYKFAQKEGFGNFLKIKDMVSGYTEEDKTKEKWFNPEWVGKYLTRLNLRQQESRSGGKKVVINKEKLKNFLVVRGVMQQDEDTIPEESAEEPKKEGQQEIQIPKKLMAVCGMCGKTAVCGKKDGERICKDCEIIGETNEEL